MASKKNNMNELEIRNDIFSWLSDISLLNNGIIDRNVLANGYSYQNNKVTLLGPTGIWTPKGFDMPISITTTTSGPYDDGINDSGIIRYKYRGADPNIRDNIGLKRIYETKTPLIYFHSIMPSKYQAIFPIYIFKNDPVNLEINAVIDYKYTRKDINYFEQKFGDPVSIAESDDNLRRYITTETKLRLHQSAFREIVISAYSRQCTICRLKHEELLDASHIIPDNQKDGLPIVQNGLSLCKIHHAAYDKKIIGITPDFEIKVRDDILQEIDGPMLKFGLQSVHNNKIILPRRKEDYPDRDRLERRYIEFVS